VKQNVVVIVIDAVVGCYSLAA